jgi:signal peptidase II
MSAIAMEANKELVMDQAVKAEKQRFSLPTIQEHLIYWPLALGGTVLDLWTKHLAFSRLEFGEAFDIIPGLLRFHLALNRGAAFSMAWGNRGFLVGISSVALVVLLAVFFLGLSLGTGKRTPFITLVLGLFTGGVAGNFYDRAFYDQGQVRDFIDMYLGQRRWPTYNIADALLCVAVGLLLIHSFTVGRKGGGAVER